MYNLTKQLPFFIIRPCKFRIYLLKFIKQYETTSGEENLLPPRVKQNGRYNQKNGADLYSQYYTGSIRE